MAKRRVLKKITKQVSTPPVDGEEISAESAQNTPVIRAKKRCLFCKSNTKPSYTDSAALRKFTNDRGKILPKLRTGTCSKHQRMITRQIKYARHLALLPFTPKV